MTHTLQVLHSAKWHQPSKDEQALRPEPSPWLATPTLRRYLVFMMSMSQALWPTCERDKRAQRY